MSQTSTSTSPQSEAITANIEFSIPGATVNARLSIPTGPTQTSEMLETCRILSKVIVDTAVEQAEKRGEHVTCKAGCGACCRQIVPIAEAEARLVSRLIEGMPEDRRATIRERFADAHRRLSDVGMLEQIEDVGRFPYSEAQSFSGDYFQLGIPCPFLEDESCSIYEDRPLSCREYLVSSSAEHCARPTAQTIRMIPLATRVSSALFKLCKRPDVDHGRWVPLIMAPSWAATQPEEVPERTGPELLGELFHRLSDVASKSFEPTGQDKEVAGESYH
jgi:Fe-S-cluster containining protein